MVAGLERDSDHVYRYMGKIVPGVTRVIDMLRDFSGISREVLANAAEIGELVHEATELDALGELDQKTIDPSIDGYFNAWRRFRSEVQPEILSCEEYVYHPTFHYAGQLDHRMVIKGRRAIVDKKTGVEDLCDAVQLSAYLQARFHDDRVELAAHDLYILSLRPNGTYKLRKYGDHFHVFLAALTCYRFKNGG